MPALPITTLLGEREPAYSYLSRLADRNAVDPHALCRDLGMDLKAIHHGSREAILSLADVGGIDPVSLLSWTPQRTDRHKYLFRGYDLTATRFRSAAWRGCPQCLAEDAETDGLERQHLRAEWAHELSFICVKHACFLEPLGRPAAKGLWPDIAADLRNTSRASKSELERISSTEFDIWFHQRLLNRPAEGWLMGLELQVALDFCDMLGRTLVRDRFPRLKDMERRDRWQAVAQGFAIANRGPEAIKEQFTEWQQTETSFADGPRRRFGALYDGLERTHLGLEYAPIRDMLRAHILETWPLAAGQNVLGEILPQRRFHSVTTAAQEASFSVPRARAILVSKGHARPVDTGRPHALELMPATVVQPVVDLLRRCVDGKQLCRQLGMTPSQFRTLQHAGVLTPVIEGSGFKPLWDLVAAKEWLEKLLRHSSVIALKSPEWLEVGVVSQRLRVSPTEVLDLISAGSLTHVGRLKGQHRYDALVVKTDEVAKQLTDQLSDKHMNIQTFAKTVGLRWPHARWLIMNAKTPSTVARNPRSGAMQHYVSCDDLEEFHQRYATAVTLAAEYKQTWQMISAVLREASAWRYAPDGKDLGQLYLRQDIQKHFETFHMLQLSASTK
ncbi:TniQ family protein [Thioclava kandeliae]|uniref:TniQ family protein n=1 Tax=Thioclava kandeliae TaxID=3070818 RepID=A0ABV1SIU2_9RHOB